MIIQKINVSRGYQYLSNELATRPYFSRNPNPDSKKQEFLKLMPLLFKDLDKDTYRRIISIAEAIYPIIGDFLRALPYPHTYLETKIDNEVSTGEKIKRGFNTGVKVLILLIYWMKFIKRCNPSEIDYMQIVWLLTRTDLVNLPLITRLLSPDSILDNIDLVTVESKLTIVPKVNSTLYNLLKYQRVVNEDKEQVYPVIVNQVRSTMLLRPHLNIGTISESYPELFSSISRLISYYYMFDEIIIGINEAHLTMPRGFPRSKTELLNLLTNQNFYYSNLDHSNPISSEKGGVLSGSEFFRVFKQLEERGILFPSLLSPYTLIGCPASFPKSNYWIEEMFHLAIDKVSSST